MGVMSMLGAINFIVFLTLIFFINFENCGQVGGSVGGWKKHCKGSEVKISLKTTGRNQLVSYTTKQSLERRK
jgi:hypothetical protein